MKFKEHNTVNTNSYNNSVPKISFGKSGSVTLNVVTCEHLGLKPDMKLEFLQDEEQPQDWYIKKNAPNGWKIRTLNQAAGNMGLGFMCKNLVRKIGKSLGVEGESFWCIVSVQSFKTEEMDFELWPIITKSVQTRSRASRQAGSGDVDMKKAS